MLNRAAVFDFVILTENNVKRDGITGIYQETSFFA